VDAVDLLLRAGADPRAVTDGGLTPRHWALIRGHADAAALLHDPHDHRPLPWIPTTSDERNSAMPPDPTSMLGRVLTTDGAPLDDGDPVAPPTTDRPLLAAASERLPTGIRVIDVCAPIVRGGTVTIAGQEGLGQLVVVAEIVQQLSRHGGASVQCGIARLPIGAATDLRDGIAPMGLQDHVAVLLADADAGPAEHERLVQQAIAAAHTLAEDRDVLLLVDRSLLPDMQTATRAAGVTPNGTVTVAILDLDPAVEDASSAQAPHEADTLLVFDEALAAANVLPAISPSRSTSRIITSATDEDAEHVSAANAVRQAANTTQRLHDFIRQPFHVAEPWTGRPGQSTGLEEAVRQAHTVK
jgi:F-type H+-transporting ATPase subunit beta